MLEVGKLYKYYYHRPWKFFENTEFTGDSIYLPDKTVFLVLESKMNKKKGKRVELKLLANNKIYYTYHYATFNPFLEVTC